MPELPLTMPKMSMTMEEGTMVSWLKNVGDAVRAGEPICEVATDKVDMEVESPFDGTLARIVAEPDETRAVGETIAYITTDADDLLGGLFDEPPGVEDAPADGTPDAVASPEEPAAAAPRNGWTPSVPLARAIAAERGIDLGAVAPTGPGGVVRVADVELAAGVATGGVAAPAAPAPDPSPAPAPAPAPAPPASAASASPAPEPEPAFAPTPAPDPTEARRRRTRHQVARVMSQSAAVPQFTAFRTLDLTTAAAERATTLGGAGWTAVLVRAQAMALASIPALTARWTEDGAVAEERIGVALAIDSPSGLIAPVIADPHRTPLDALAEEIKDLVDATRSGSLPLERLSGGTTVFSNLGGFGVESFNALITPPHATALSAGSVAQRLLTFRDGSFAPRLTCIVGLTVDHRVADGADAARFLAELAAIVADPGRLVG